MVGVSSINRLPKEVQGLITSWFDQGCTVDEVTEHLQAMGAPVSRSAVGRKRQEWGQIISQVRESREAAEVLARTFRDAPASEMAQANIEILHTLMQRILRAEMTQEKMTLKPNEMMFLGKAIKDLTSARKAEVGTTIVAEQAIQESVQEETDAQGNILEIQFVDPKPQEASQETPENE